MVVCSGFVTKTVLITAVASVLAIAEEYLHSVRTFFFPHSAPGSE